MSDDGSAAIVIIALLGNPFSPDYARARELGASNPLTFCSMNVAIYAGRASAWTFEECVVRDIDRTASSLAIGRSVMRWEPQGLTVDIDERTSLLGHPVRGRVILRPEAITDIEVPIDEGGLHCWWPAAPVARIEVDLPSPGVRFSGHGYHDANAGAVPLDATFEIWNWSRARQDDGALLTYDVVGNDGMNRALAFKVSKRGAIEHLEGLWNAPLGSTRWGIKRQARVDSRQGARIVRSLEDGPFYARALVESRLNGSSVVAMHEVLAAHRLRRQWVRFLTRFRMRTPTRFRRR